jgi:hypothetical protein
MSEGTLPAVRDTSVMTDDERIAYTQDMRKRLVDKMTDNGEKMPEEKGDRMVLLQALADIDRSALGNKRIVAAKKDGDDNRNIALIIAQMAQTKYQTPTGSPFEGNVIEGEFREVPQLDDHTLPDLKLVPGETDIGISTRSFDEFMKESGE